MDTTQPSDSGQDIHILQPLMRSRGVITMPYEFRYEDYREIEEALDWVSLNTDYQPIVKFLGLGGDYSCSMGIGEMLRDYDAISVLVGGSYSGHTIAFMMSNYRFVYPSAYFGIHSASVMPFDRPYTRTDFLNEAETHEYMDNQIAHLFAKNSRQSDHDEDFWKRFHADARLSTKLIDAGRIVHAYGLAKPISELPEGFKVRLGKRRYDWV